MQAIFFSLEKKALTLIDTVFSVGVLFFCNFEIKKKDTNNFPGPYQRQFLSPVPSIPVNIPKTCLFLNSNNFHVRVELSTIG